MTDDELAANGWPTADADLVFVGHTHRPLDRVVGSMRVINLGGVSVPATPERRAMWTFLEATADGITLERCVAPYDMDAVFTALDTVRHPSGEWLKRKFASTASPDDEEPS